MTASTQSAAISRRSLARYILPVAALAVPGAATLLPAAADAADRRRRARNPRLQAGTTRTGAIYVSGKGFAAGEQVNLELRFDWNSYSGTYGSITSGVAQTDERGGFYLEISQACPYDLDVTATQRRGVAVNQYFANFLCGII